MSLHVIVSQNCVRSSVHKKRSFQLPKGLVGEKYILNMFRDGNNILKTVFEKKCSNSDFFVNFAFQVSITTIIANIIFTFNCLLTVILSRLEKEVGMDNLH